MKKTFYLPMMIAAFTPSLFAAHELSNRNEELQNSNPPSLNIFSEQPPHQSVQEDLPDELQPFVTNVGTYGKVTLTLTREEFNNYFQYLLSNQSICIRVKKGT